MIKCASIFVEAIKSRANGMLPLRMDYNYSWKDGYTIIGQNNYIKAACLINQLHPETQLLSNSEIQNYGKKLSNIGLFHSEKKAYKIYWNKKY